MATRVVWFCGCEDDAYRAEAGAAERSALLVRNTINSHSFRVIYVASTPGAPQRFTGLAQRMEYGRNFPTQFAAAEKIQIARGALLTDVWTRLFPGKVAVNNGDTIIIANSGHGTKHTGDFALSEDVVVDHNVLLAGVTRIAWALPAKGMVTIVIIGSSCYNGVLLGRFAAELESLTRGVQRKLRVLVVTTSSVGTFFSHEGALGQAWFHSAWAAFHEVAYATVIESQQQAVPLSRFLLAFFGHVNDEAGSGLEQGRVIVKVGEAAAQTFDPQQLRSFDAGPQGGGRVVDALPNAEDITVFFALRPVPGMVDVHASNLTSFDKQLAGTHRPVAPILGQKKYDPHRRIYRSRPPTVPDLSWMAWMSEIEGDEEHVEPTAKRRMIVLNFVLQRDEHPKEYDQVQVGDDVSAFDGFCEAAGKRPVIPEGRELVFYSQGRRLCNHLSVKPLSSFTHNGLIEARVTVVCDDGL